MNVPTTLVPMNGAGPSMERSTWAFGGQVHHRVGPVGGEDLPHRIGVADIGLHVHVPGVAQSFLQRVLRGGVGHLIDVDDVVAGGPDEVADDGRADEATAAGKQDTHQLTSGAAITFART